MQKKVGNEGGGSQSELIVGLLVCVHVIDCLMEQVASKGWPADLWGRDNRLVDTRPARR